MPSRKQKFQHPFVRWLRTSPIIKTTVVAIPMTWHGIVLGFYGKQNRLLSNSGEVTAKGLHITLAAYSFVILYTLIINVFDRIRIMQESDYSSIARFVLAKTMFLYDSKLSNQKSMFYDPNYENTFFL